MGGSDETDAGKEEYGAEYKIDEDFLYILHSATCLHKIDCTQDKAGYSQER